MSGPVRYGSAPRSEPQEGPAGRREVPFGPEISWPYGFRPLDPESRDVLESAYGADAVYQQPAVNDYGYGDPGYYDPSYEGPRSPSNGPAFGYPAPGDPASDDPASGGPASGGWGGGPGGASAPRAFGGSGYRKAEPEIPGYHVPENRDSSRPGYPGPGYQLPDPAPSSGQDFAPSAGGDLIWPVTGAQAALPDTGPQPVPGTFPPPGGAASPGSRYDQYDQPRPATSRSADPRLEGINYDELRYDDSPGEPGYGDALDDESWYEELRRSAPAYPQRSEPQGPGTPQRRLEPQAPGYGPRVPGHGPQPGYPQAPDRAAGYGRPRGDRGGSEPQLSAGAQLSAGSAAGPGPRGDQPGSAFPPAPGVHGTDFLSAPAAPAGLLTSPAGVQVDALRDGAFPAAAAAGQVLAPPDANRPGAAAVRPGHGLDGPEITASWPVQPQADDLRLDGPEITASWPAQPQADDPDAFQEFWREDDDDAEYTGMFGDREARSGRVDARTAHTRPRIGRRRGRSNDHRLWLALGAVVLVAATTIIGIIKLEFPSRGGPAHTMVTPPMIGDYVRTEDLEKHVNLAQLRAEVIKMSSGQASQVVSAVYEQGNSAAGNNEQIIMFIGGHLANADPAASIAGFTQKFPGATVVSAGVLGGRAACVEEGTSVAMCAWFDDDSFGEIVSPTMNASALASTMLTVRPSVELVVKQ